MIVLLQLTVVIRAIAIKSTMAIASFGRVGLTIFRAGVSLHALQRGAGTEVAALS
jgi:hypothetical protein